MEPTGQVLRIEIQDEGTLTFKEPPVVSISSPKAEYGKPAKAVAKLSGGKLATIVLTEKGSGYSLEDTPVIKILSETRARGSGGSVPVFRPVLEMGITGVEITQAGTGYAVEKPIKIYASETTSNRKEIVAMGYPRGASSSFTAYRVPGDNKVKAFENALDNNTVISGASSGGSVPALPFPTKASSSQQLLSLLPEGFGLDYDQSKRQYYLTAEQSLQEKYADILSNEANPKGRLVPDFGPRGESPIERNMNIDVPTFLRFCLSGAICSSGVHLVLTPLDVVKTKVQTNPDKYPTIAPSFTKIWKEDGPGAFFTGWLPTLSGNFVSGAVLYAMTELIRRSLTDTAGVNADNLEVFIILVAAGLSSAVAAIFYCPFEAIRIRVVAQPQFASNSFETASKMIQEEGVGSLTNAIPVFLVKQIPYACVKFTIFDLSTENLYRLYPAAQEDLILSLGISLIGGVLGGVAAAAVSNPADTVIAELKKAKSDQTPAEALQALLDRAGAKALFKGLPLRMVFYSLTASLQFMVFDGVRFALGIGPDDLRLYLDVLRGVLAEKNTIA